VSELELRLEELGRELHVPDPPDLAPAVARQIAAADRPPAPLWRRRALLVAVAALLVAVGAVFAVPQARSAILDFFGIGSAEIRIVDELPEVESGPLDLGTPTTLERVRDDDPALLEPDLDDLSPPDSVYVAGTEPGSPVTFLWGELDRPRLLLTQVRGRFNFEKLIRGGSGFVLTNVNGANAVWIEGEPHVVFYESEGGGADLPGRLARNTLVWSRGPATLRLEGELSRERAEEIARTVR
jgi:hypothetical protein